MFSRLLHPFLSLQTVWSNRRQFRVGSRNRHFFKLWKNAAHPVLIAAKRSPQNCSSSC